MDISIATSVHSSRKEIKTLKIELKTKTNEINKYKKTFKTKDSIVREIINLPNASKHDEDSLLNNYLDRFDTQRFDTLQ